jgi:hypothetical protein
MISQTFDIQTKKQFKCANVVFFKTNIDNANSKMIDLKQFDCRYY